MTKELLPSTAILKSSYLLETTTSSSLYTTNNAFKGEIRLAMNYVTFY